MSEAFTPYEPSEEERILRYSQQVVLKIMNEVRNMMRGSMRLVLKEAVADQHHEKDPENRTKGIDRMAEEMIVNAFEKKFAKIKGLTFTIFSEECGIKTFPAGVADDDSDLVVFVDPIDGTEFMETLQGGWCLVAVYDRRIDATIAAVAGDMFRDRLYWAYRNGPADCEDYQTHTRFYLDGGLTNKTSVAEKVRVNLLTTKVDRYRKAAEQERLLDKIEAGGGRINLAGGSDMVLQVAAGYADAAVEFAKGFATYDILPGFFIAQRAGLCVVDLDGQAIGDRLDIDDIFRRFKEEPDNPVRTKFVVTKNPALAEEILGLIDR